MKIHFYTLNFDWNNTESDDRQESNKLNLIVAFNWINVEFWDLSFLHHD